MGVFLYRVIGVCLLMNVHVTIMADCSSQMIPFQKTATHGEHSVLNEALFSQQTGEMRHIQLYFQLYD